MLLFSRLFDYCSVMIFVLFWFWLVLICYYLRVLIYCFVNFANVFCMLVYLDWDVVCLKVWKLFADVVGLSLLPIWVLNFVLLLVSVLFVARLNACLIDLVLITLIELLLLLGLGLACVLFCLFSLYLVLYISCFCCCFMCWFVIGFMVCIVFVVFMFCWYDVFDVICCYSFACFVVFGLLIRLIVWLD